MSAPNASHAGSEYRPDIDGLRAIAVLAVVIFHAWPSVLPGGFVGVDVFFVISGFLITGIILGGLARGTFTFAEFYARRIKRIFPALIVVLTAVYAAGWFFLYADDYQRLNRHIVAAVAFVSNFLLRNEAGYFDAAADLKPLQHLWSLGIEEQFYLAWPALLVAAWRLRVAPLALTGLLMSVSFLFNVYSIRTDLVTTFYSPFTRVWELLIGAALAAVYQRGWRGLTGPIAVASSVTGLLSIAVGVALLNGTRLFPGLWALLPSLGAALIIASGEQAWFNRWILSSRPLVAVGLISYPLYLWHWPLLSFARIVEGGTPSVATRAVMVAASVLLAWLTFVAIEKPVRFGRWRQAAVPVLGVLMAAILTVGWLTVRADGWLSRPITNNDRAQFLQYYNRMHRQGISEAYRQECDFMDWPTGEARNAIDASCTEAGRERTVLLWGDSYAQSLSAGLRAAAPVGTAVAQVATSMCRPSFDDVDPHVPGGRCRRANDFAVATISALKPEVVVIAQKAPHLQTDWPALTQRILAAGARRVVLAGPVPVWSPSLPEVITSQYWGRSYDRVSFGLAPAVFTVDRELKARTAGVSGLTYVSLVDGLCSGDACQAVVGSGGWQDLITFDSGHLSPQGSVFVVERLLRQAVFGAR